MAFFDPSVSTTTSTSFTQLPEWLRQQYRDTTSRASELSAEPYPTFPGPRYADFAPDELAAFQRARGIQGLGAGTLEQGINAIGGALEAPSLSGIQQFMNPFTQEVTDRALREIDVDRQQRLNNLGQQAAQMGAFGGSRQAILESETNRQFDELSADTAAKLAQQNYQQALKQFNTQQRLGLEAAPELRRLGLTQRRLGQADVEDLLGIGGLQRELGQRNLDFAFNEFMRQRDWPYSQLRFMNEILRGTPTSAFSTRQQTQQAPGPSGAQQALGLGIGTLGTLGSFGLFDEGGALDSGILGLLGF